MSLCIHTLIHPHWMSSFCNCAISLTNWKLYWIFKVGLRHVLFYVKPSILCLYYLLIVPVVPKLHRIRESNTEKEKEDWKKLDTNNEFMLDRVKLVNKRT